MNLLFCFNMLPECALSKTCSCCLISKSKSLNVPSSPEAINLPSPLIAIENTELRQLVSSFPVWNNLTLEKVKVD